MSSELLEYLRSKETQEALEKAVAKRENLRTQFLGTFRKVATEGIFALFPPSAGATTKQMQGFISLSMLFYDAIKFGCKLAGALGPLQTNTSSDLDGPPTAGPVIRSGSGKVEAAGGPNLAAHP